MPLPHDLDPWTVELGSILNTTCADRPTSIEAFTTPMSYANGVGYLGQPSDPTTPLTFDFPSPFPEVGGSGPVCACVQTQATNVTTLHRLTSRESSDRFDLAMKSVTATLDTCDTFIACLDCEKSFSAILLTLSAVEMIFKLFEQLIFTNQCLLPQDDQPMVFCSLGDYKVSQEEGQAIQNVLLKMTLSKAKQTLDSLHSLVNDPMELFSEKERFEHGADQESPPVLGGLSNVDQDYILQCITRKKTVLDVLMTTVIV